MTMANFNPQLAIDLLSINRKAFGTTAQEQDAYIKEAEARLGARSSDDRREAAKLAVETAKMFLTISVGVLVASFAWMQFARKDGVPWLSLSLLPFYAASGLLVWSMVSGFLAISKIYRRADGREAATEPAWSTAAVAGCLNAQSWTGAAALLALAIGVVVLGLGPGIQKPAVSVTIPAQVGAPPSTGSLTIEGTWTELRLKTAAQQEIKLPQQALPVTITCQ
jgi:hypothetical protein